MNFVPSLSIRMLNGNEFFSLEKRMLSSLLCVILVVSTLKRRLAEGEKDLHEAKGEYLKLSILKSVLSELN